MNMKLPIILVQVFIFLFASVGTMYLYIFGEKFFQNKKDKKILIFKKIYYIFLILLYLTYIVIHILSIIQDILK